MKTGEYSEIRNSSEAKRTKIQLAHSPDSDDAFMFYGIASGGTDIGEFSIEQITKDIETLNQEAKKGKYDVSAISFASYPLIRDQYLLMSCGSSFGMQYGPVVLAKNNWDSKSITDATIAIPGDMTTAYLLLRLCTDCRKTIVLPFEEIIPAIANGDVEAGLVIHEGQLTYAESGLKKIVDLGRWWYEETKLPLPLGGNVVKRELGEKTIADLTKIVSQSIRYALANYDDALQYASSYARNMSKSLIDQYVRMYVNDLSVDCGAQGKQAVKKLFDLAAQKQIIEQQFNPEFV